MELKAAIDKRRTIRDFEQKNVPADVIEYAIRNGFKAPTYNHLREWDFIVVNNLVTKLKLIEAEKLDTPIDVTQLEDHFRNEELIMKEMYLDAIPKQKKMILEAPAVIIVVFKPKNKIGDAKKIYDLNCLASVWACIENFLLSLAEHDVFGVTFIPQNIEVIKSKLNIPEHLEIAAVIPVGYKSANAKELKQKEIDVAKRIHNETW